VVVGVAAEGSGAGLRSSADPRVALHDAHRALLSSESGDLWIIVVVCVIMIAGLCAMAWCCNPFHQKEVDVAKVQLTKYNTVLEETEMPDEFKTTSR
jgi:hypothetical protein